MKLPIEADPAAKWLISRGPWLAQRLLTAGCTMMRYAALVALFMAACVDGGDDDHDHANDGELFEQAYDDNLVEPKADGSDCSGVRVPDRGGFAKRIALTFDDGPNPETTPAVIQVLKAHGAPATFFTNGSKYNSSNARAIARAIADDPDYILANHSQNHRDLGRTSDLQVVYREIAATDQLIRDTDEEPTYFRFPFGSSTCDTKRIAQNQGYIVTGWHIDSADWCYAAGGGICKPETFRHVPDELRSDMAGFVLSQARAWNGGIVLFHDIHRNTAANLDAILTALEAEGFRFVRLDDTSAFPKLHRVAPTP